MPAELTVANRLASLDRVKAEAARFAAKIKHKNREYKRTRLMAAMMISEAIGADYSEEQLRKSGCPYIRVRRTPLTETETFRTWRRESSTVLLSKVTPGSTVTPPLFNAETPPWLAALRVPKGTCNCPGGRCRRLLPEREA
jgi:hypothetical protein